MAKLTHEGQRAVVTGAGKGIGRAHALELGRRGVSVVVNDFDRAAADAVVAEIKSGGGKAVANYDSVGGKAAGQSIIDAAVREFGGLEIVINNAGFLRTNMFENMTEAQIDAILEVHLLGTIYVTQAAWPIMQKQKYGRVVITSSASGMFAHQGQINYCSAKAGCYGLTKALAYEGQDHGVKVNALLPMAPTGIDRYDPIPNMAEEFAKFITPQLRDETAGATNDTPEMIAYMAAYLVSRECEVTGEAYSICRGRFGRVFVGVADGWLTRKGDDVSAETVADHLAQIRDISHSSAPKWLYDEVRDVTLRLQQAR
ncbi:MAG: SDR family NAD(P)-dependent oxidoreductase [Caulobacteraceae bacterium]|nr:SDR family NAD(P)-dependent oxidoreductase [Caulobacteraceae bacterium]